MDVLILGNGGREDAFAASFRKSNIIDNTFSYGCNGGLIKKAKCLDMSFDDLINFSKTRDIFVVAGSEKFLFASLGDQFRNAGIKFFGPGKKGALLEEKKAYARTFAKKYRINAPGYEVVRGYAELLDYIKKAIPPYVLKISGPAYGKGVSIINDNNEAIKWAHDVFQKRIFPDAGEDIVIEEYIEGYEISAFALVNSKGYLLLPYAQDYKRLYEKDLGPNTGGMGAIAPYPVNSSLHEKIKILFDKFYEGIKTEDIEYTGFLYMGLMIKDNTPYLLEFNVRMGDPETQAVLPLLKEDLAEKILSCINEEELKNSSDIKPEKSVSVVLASKGYPIKYKKGNLITLHPSLKEEKNIHIFHAGTVLKEKKLYTNGGRVLTVTALSDSFKNAREKAYKIIEQINFEGKYFRKDIGRRLINE